MPCSCDKQDEDIVYSPTKISGNRGYQGDKAKGIIAKPMPRHWHDHYSAIRADRANDTTLQQAIVADRKPYFMRYIYPSLLRTHHNYIKSTKENALRRFGKTVAELLATPPEERTEQEQAFVRAYHTYLPMGMGDCVVNRICKRIEQEFDHYLTRHKAEVPFDYTIYKSDKEYTDSQLRKLKVLYDEFASRMRSYTHYAIKEKVDSFEKQSELQLLREEFRRKCEAVCPNAQTLCNLLLDLCYSQSGSKRFAWQLCGKEMVENVLSKHDCTLSFPVLDKEGKIAYGGHRFTVVTKRVGETE